jgi:hypothetical protein
MPAPGRARPASRQRQDAAGRRAHLHLPHRAGSLDRASLHVLPRDDSAYRTADNATGMWSDVVTDPAPGTEARPGDLGCCLHEVLVVDRRPERSISQLDLHRREADRVPRAEPPARPQPDQQLDPVAVEGSAHDVRLGRRDVELAACCGWLGTVWSFTRRGPGGHCSPPSCRSHQPIGTSGARAAAGSIAERRRPPA